MAASLFPSLLKVRGKKQTEHGLLHRIDCDTQGLLLIASSQDFYDYMLNEQKEGRFIKTYLAVCERCDKNSALIGGFPPYEGEALYKAGEEAVISSRFRAYGKGRKEVRPVSSLSSCIALKKCKGSPLYATRIKIRSSNGESLTAECSLSRGARHQVRCHLAWAGVPVKGDRIYNCKERGKEGGKMEFYAVKIEFFLPCTHEKKCYTLPASLPRQFLLPFPMRTS